MEQCLYEPVIIKQRTILNNDKIAEKASWKPFLKQFLISSSIWNAFFICGLCLGAPTVIIPQLRREANSTEVVTEEMASWLSSVHGYAALPWLILSLTSAKIGRKYPFFVVNGISLISYIILYFSSTAKYILFANILQGAIFACDITICIVIIVEYTSPKHRGLFLTLKSASSHWGIWIANTFGTFFHWRTIAIAGIVCSLYNLVVSSLLCESPSWLASKYRYEECARVHRCIKGKDAESEEELAALIKSCNEYQDQQDKEKIKQTKFWIRLYKMMLDKAFYMPFLLGMGIITLVHSTGKLVCNVYAIDIIKKITSDESTAYTGMLLLDGVTVVGMYIGCGISKYVKRRTLFMTGSLGGIVFLFILSFYLYLCKSKVISENVYASLLLLTLFFLFISFGPLILGSAIFGELMPLRYRIEGMFLIGLWADIDLATTLITGPPIFKTFDLHGAFLFYGIKCSIIIYFLYKYLPETKDKTLQEIEEYYVCKQNKEESLEIQPMCN